MYAGMSLHIVKFVPDRLGTKRESTGRISYRYDPYIPVQLRSPHNTPLPDTQQRSALTSLANLYASSQLSLSEDADSLGDKDETLPPSTPPRGDIGLDDVFVGEFDHSMDMDMDEEAGDITLHQTFLVTPKTSQSSPSSQTFIHSGIFLSPLPPPRLPTPISRLNPRLEAIKTTDGTTTHCINTYFPPIVPSPISEKKSFWPQKPRTNSMTTSQYWKLLDESGRNMTRSAVLEGDSSEKEDVEEEGKGGLNMLADAAGMGTNEDYRSHAEEPRLEYVKGNTTPKSERTRIASVKKLEAFPSSPTTKDEWDEDEDDSRGSSAVRGRHLPGGDLSRDQKARILDGTQESVAPYQSMLKLTILGHPMAGFRGV
jgi:hypothetical protein